MAIQRSASDPLEVLGKLMKENPNGDGSGEQPPPDLSDQGHLLGDRREDGQDSAQFVEDSSSADPEKDRQIDEIRQAVNATGNHSVKASQTPSGESSQQVKEAAPPVPQLIWTKLPEQTDNPATANFGPDSHPNQNPPKNS
ncbi:MAG: hypothetical protein COU69_01470 [Candidatus Pacebacteria bacterium CG10_big_fil_rev_8_21_14_0_10_56_10]|nr:MAG: hypothetical protein COU69_01470 [Candidatus Pacebacteria bacterium CG10_big_fil_rev_8_21_14_0_10_56_10]